MGEAEKATGIGCSLRMHIECLPWGDMPLLPALVLRTQVCGRRPGVDGELSFRDKQTAAEQGGQGEQPGPGKGHVVSHPGAARDLDWVHGGLCWRRCQNPVVSL